MAALQQALYLFLCLHFCSVCFFISPLLCLSVFVGMLYTLNSETFKVFNDCSSLFFFCYLQGCVICLVLALGWAFAAYIRYKDLPIEFWITWLAHPLFSWSL